MPVTSRTLQHVGEWKIELHGDSPEELFAELARVLAAAAGRCRSPRDTGAWERVEIVARDRATLLVDWANELIGRGEVAGRAYGEIRGLLVEPAPPSSTRVSAEVRGDVVEEWRSPVKAATYHDAVVEQRDGGWRGVVLLDV